MNPILCLPHLSRIINSDEVHFVVRPIKKEIKRAPLKKNPLKNLNVMLKLNPYAKASRRMALLAEAPRVRLNNGSSTRRGTRSLRRRRLQQSRLPARHGRRTISVKNNGTNMEAKLVNQHLYKALKCSVFQILDTTEMSEYRDDAHPSAGGGKKHDDCMHWFLPRITYTWNDLFIAHLNNFKVRN
ncbi:Protein trichome birefringence-like 13 [Abeliophyllum distichum]|uniref:Protein trichome birefringence-like 13 n=1 Tax=Abeliophyllum distichum TaxID=126358 RepID=A0ABD1RW28_9LAMI